MKAAGERARDCGRKADAVIDDLQDEGAEPLTARAVKDSTETAKQMESLLFSKGGIDRIVFTLSKFLDRPVVREAARLVETPSDRRTKTKQVRFTEVIFKAAADFFRGFRRRGNLFREDKNAIEAALSALVSSDIKEQRFATAVHRAFGVSRRLIRTATMLRKSLEDREVAHWVRVPPRSYVASVQDGTFDLYARCFAVISFGANITFLFRCYITEHIQALSELFHSDDFTIIDNSNKVEYLIPLDRTADGKLAYDLHFSRVLKYTKDDMRLQVFGEHPNEPLLNKPHPVFKKIQEETKTEKRPNGIKGSSKLLGKCLCRCMKNKKIHFCVCPLCVSFEENLRLYHHSRKQWHKEYLAERKRAALANGESAEAVDAGDQNRFACDCSNGACHEKERVVNERDVNAPERDVNAPEKKNFRTFSETPRGCMAYLLCPKVHYPELDLRGLDKNDRETEVNVPFMSFMKDCCLGACRQAHGGGYEQTTMVDKCGWNQRFSAMPAVCPTLNAFISFVIPNCD